MSQMKRIIKKVLQLSAIMKFRNSRRLNNHYEIERRLANFYQTDKVLRIRQILWLLPK